MKMAFVYLSNYSDWPMGGMLNYVRNIIPYFKDNNICDVDIWGGTKDKEEKTSFEIDDREYKFFKYTDIHTYNKLLPNFLVSFFGALKNGYRFKEYDVIYSHTAATTIALKLTNPHKCVVHHQHGLSYKNNKGFTRFLNIGYTIAQLISDATIFVASTEELEEHQKRKIFKNKRFYAIGSPIKYKKIRQVCIEKKRKNYLRFVYTGRLDAWKNINLLIDSFKMYHDECAQQDVLTLVGDGPQYEELLTRIKKEEVDYIKLVGRKNFDELSLILAQSDIFLFPSRGEGVSLSLLEAFAAGLPAVAFDVIGVNNFVKEGKTGVLEKEITAENFKNGIVRASKGYDRWVQNCVNVSKDYDAEIIGEKIMKIIVSVA